MRFKLHLNFKLVSHFFTTLPIIHISTIFDDMRSISHNDVITCEFKISGMNVYLTTLGVVKHSCTFFSEQVLELIFPIPMEKRYIVSGLYTKLLVRSYGTTNLKFK